MRLTQIEGRIQCAARESGSAREDLLFSVLDAIGDSNWTSKNTGEDCEGKDERRHRGEHLPQASKQCFLIPNLWM
jgi:hypothetical protein